MMIAGRSVSGVVAAALTAAAACSTLPSSDSGNDDRPPEASPPSASTLICTVSQDQIVDGGVGVGAIPALNNPELVPPGAEGTGYLETTDEAGTAAIRDHDRVIVFRTESGWVAVPHNILWWHEVAQFSWPNRDVVVTYCPLTGSSLVFDLGGVRVSQFQVSGLLYNSNLMMRDPETGSLWPQMTRGAVCGPRRGTKLSTLPSLEVRWETWKELHPNTRVVSSRTGYDRNYSRYPYGRYEDSDAPLFFDVDEIDRRRPIKERVLGIPAGRGGVAYPFGELSVEGRETVVVRDTAAGEPVAVLWHERAYAAAAYHPRAGGRHLTLRGEGTHFVDEETGSRWSLDGVAMDGPMEGERLQPVTDAYVSFWFAWAVFQPDTRLWVRQG